MRRLVEKWNYFLHQTFARHSFCMSYFEFVGENSNSLIILFLFCCNKTQFHFIFFHFFACNFKNSLSIATKRTTNFRWQMRKGFRIRSVNRTVIFACTLSSVRAKIFNNNTWATINAISCCICKMRSTDRSLDEKIIYQGPFLKGSKSDTKACKSSF